MDITQHTLLELWPNGAPGALGFVAEDRPTLQPYLLPGEARPCVIVCPGGGYSMLSTDHEGEDVAKWLNELGIAALVLRYRLGPRYHHPCMMLDAARALRYTRAHAAEWGIDPNRIAMMGFSAGGHLSATLGTLWDGGNPQAEDPIDRMGCRPDALILAYPVISMREPATHGGSRIALLGTSPDPELVAELSTDEHVTAQTPPTFIFCTADDDIVPSNHSLRFASALAAAGVPYELHVYAHGPHGIGLARGSHFMPVLCTWPDRLADWLQGRGFSPAS